VSSEHVTVQVPLAEIRDADMLQDPKSGNRIKRAQDALRVVRILCHAVSLSTNMFAHFVGATRVACDDKGAARALEDS
jgi:hypothetical protein